jgi:two-component system OmpR family response regulator
MHILVVEDEIEIARDIGETLESANFVVSYASDGEEADFLGFTEDYDAVILDLGLPKMDGLTVLKNWRRENRNFPVLILTARGSWQDKVEGIDSGGDDYLAKPFEMEELMARLRSIIRRSEGHVTPILECGPLKVDSRTSQVFLNGRLLALSPLEFRALYYLIHHRGRPVTRTELMDHIYETNNDRDTNALEVLIGRLRKKVGNDIIKTRRGLGYIIE